MKWLAALIVVLGAGPGCGSAPRRHEVEIRGMAFHPAVLEAAVGDTVVWVNHDIVPHNATATGDVAWSTGDLRRGEQGHHVMGGAGEVDYICTLHPIMTGRLIIR